MTIIRTENFGGIIPLLDEKRLPPNCAVEAINVDLVGGGIKPLKATLLKRNNGSLTTPAAILQWPTACFMLVGMTAAGYVSFAPASGNYVIAANDELVYAVYLPAGTTAAGQGAIDLHFTDATTLGNVNDRNAIGSLTGDITARAQGQWYVREVSLATVVGKTVDEVRFYNNNANAAPLTAYFGEAFIRTSPASGAPKCVLWDADAQQTIQFVSSTTNIRTAVQTVIDEDESPVTTHYAGVGAIDIDAYAMIAPAGFDGLPRNKMVSVETRSIPATNSVIGWSNHDRFNPYDLDVNNGNHSLYSALTGGWVTSSAGSGWVAVPMPTAAMALAIVGGAGPAVTRSYVYTRVSEDGLESGPSPVVTATGNRDGTWQLTTITSWAGTDSYNGIRNAAKKRIYRTPEGSSTYRFVAEIAATSTSANDTAADAALGEALPTTAYQDPPRITAISPWINGMMAGLVNEGTQVAVCEPYEYHAWPIAYRTTMPAPGVTLRAFGDRVVILTSGKPQVLTGRSASALVLNEVGNGEACIGRKGVVASDIGVIYPGVTGWGFINYSGFQNLSSAYFLAPSYAAVVSKDTVAMFDNRKLAWITQGATTGYVLELGAKEKGLTKFEVPDPIYAMSYYGPRDARWIAYTSGGVLKFGKLWGDSTQNLKWTWKSGLKHTERPVSFMVAQIESTDWDTLSASMKGREAALLTVPPGVPYTIVITGLTQTEAWCYLKVWAEADKGADKVLVYDDFVIDDKPVVLAGGILSDCWQFELRGNIPVASITLAETERELNVE